MRRGFTFIECMIVVIIILFILLAIGGCVSSLHTEHGQVFTVKEKAVVGKSGKYLIYTDKTTYEVEDSWLHWRWNSSDVYGNIEVGKTYTCTLQGYRVPFLSWYPNIVDPVVVDSVNAEKK